MVLAPEKSAVYYFDGFCLDVQKRRVVGPDGNPLALKAKAFETLLFLVENSGRVIDRDELLAAIWPDTVVEENNLTQHISSLRRMFGEKRDDNHFIATVPGRGYQFVAHVHDAGARQGDAVPSGRASRKWLILTATGVVASLLVLGFLFTNRSATSNNRSIRSIAVLPFKPIDEQKRDVNLEMALTQDLITRLTGAEGLDVKQLPAIRRFNSPEQDAIAAGHDLGVEAVVDASVQTLGGDRIRVYVTVYSVADAKSLLAQPFDAEGSDLEMQDKICARIETALRVKLGEHATKRYTENVQAYRLYITGRLLLSTLNPTEMARAIGYFQQAIDLDPNYALAYTGISDVYRSRILSGEEPPTEIAQRAIEAADKAINIDPELAEAHTNIGIISFWYRRDWSASEDAFKRALQINPHLSLAHHHYAHLLSNIGRHGEAIAHANQVGAAERSNPFHNTVVGLVYQQAGNYEVALKRYDEANRLASSVWLARFFAAVAYTDQGRYEDALINARKATQLNGSQSISTAYECVALVRLGRADEAKKVLESLRARSSERYVPPYHLAIAYMGLGNRENALAQLEKSHAEQDVKIVFLKADHIWDELRSEPRFIELMKKMKLAA